MQATKKVGSKNPKAIETKTDQKKRERSENAKCDFSYYLLRDIEKSARRQKIRWDMIRLGFQSFWPFFSSSKI